MTREKSPHFLGDAKPSRKERRRFEAIERKLVRQGKIKPRGYKFDPVKGTVTVGRIDAS